MTFLRCSESKAELFPFLSNVFVKEIQDEVLVSIVNENVVTNGAGLDILSSMPCNVEEDLCSCKTCFKRAHSHNDHDS